MTLALGFDLGGSTARAAVVERETGRVVESVKSVLVERDVAAVIATVVGLVKQLPKTEGAAGAGFAAMLRGGMVLNAPNLGWRNVDFGSQLSKALGRDVKLMNDLSAAAWGEFKAGAARGVTDSFTVFAGTGVGSAIISNGALVTGAMHVAGEFGHVKLFAEGGRRCGCGQDGCLEAYAGGAKLGEWMKEEGLSGTAGDLEALALGGNAIAGKLYDFVSTQLSLAIANQVSVLNPAVLVLGGGVLSRSPRLMQQIRDTIHRRSTVESSRVRVEVAQLGDDAGLVGAALAA